MKEGAEYDQNGRYGAPPEAGPRQLHVTMIFNPESHFLYLEDLPVHKISTYGVVWMINMDRVWLLLLFYEELVSPNRNPQTVTRPSTNHCRGSMAAVEASIVIIVIIISIISIISRAASSSRQP